MCKIRAQISLNKNLFSKFSLLLVVTLGFNMEIVPFHSRAVEKFNVRLSAEFEMGFFRLEFMFCSLLITFRFFRISSHRVGVKRCDQSIDVESDLICVFN